MNPSGTINTELISDQYRRKGIDLSAKKVLITDFRGSQQEQDLTSPCNCGGYGRIRHFKRKSGPHWPNNPLPIDPASEALQLPPGDVIRAQAFQNAICNWRCWYCFVDFALLSANPKHSAWLTVEDLLDRYLSESDPPSVIDLTGGQPDLTPEWVVWMLELIKRRGLEERVYLWSDDNLSNDYFWKYLSDAERRMLVECKTYGRVCCFKGYNAESFAFNTLASPQLFEQQFELFGKYVTLGLDVYGYVSLTAPSADNQQRDMRSFVDRLQRIHPLLPLRVIPLEIRVFTPVQGRLDDAKREALIHQQSAIQCWEEELDRRFSVSDRSSPIQRILLR